MTGKLSRTSRVAQWTLITLLVLSLFGGAVYFVSARSGRGLPYRDSFAAGKTDEWHSYGGTWEVVDSAIRNESNERGAKLITGSPNWKNYSIEGDIMIRSITGYASDAGFVLRSSDEEQGVYAYYGYFALLHTVKNEGGSLLLGRVGQKPIVIKSVPLPSGLQTHIWYHLKLLALGCRFFASVRLLPTDGTYTVELKDPPCLTHGRGGLLSSHAGGVWRNIVIQSATERDADLMHAMIAAQVSAASLVPSLKNEIAPAEPAARTMYEEQAPAPAISISNARLKSLVSPIRATISGQVILTSPDLFVQDYSGGTPVHLSGNAQLKIGDEVTATGNVLAHGLNSVMEDASLRVLWEGTPTPAMSVTASRIATGVYDGQYIEVEGTLARKSNLSSGLLELDFNASPQTYEAIVYRGRGADLFRRIEPRSSVRVRGVATRDPQFFDGQTAFAVLVRSTDDVQVIAGPPWWRLRNLILLAGLLITVILIIDLLYRRIEKLKFLAVVQERERLAYEMHDTLAQSVAGIGFQLEAIRAIVPPEQTEMQKQLKFAHELVRHSHAEAHRGINMLRPHDLQRQGLLSALKDCAMQLVNSNDILISAESIGTPQSINLITADVLFRIGQEALANAVRHASPTSLKLVLEYKDKAIILSVRDNGCGFDRDSHHHTLGIMSMHKRAEAISANLMIHSVPREGTLVTVSAPLSGKTVPGFWRKIFRLKQVAS